MIDIILSHWALYFLLAWLVVLGVIGAVNLWPKRKSASPGVTKRFALTGAPDEAAPPRFKDDFKLSRHDR